MLGLSLGVDDLTVEVGTKSHEPRVILNHVQVVFQPCKLYAIMGPSGSGKTTFLNAIAGRTRTRITSEPPVDKRLSPGCTRLTGRLYLNGCSVSGADIQRHSRYVMQRDELMPFLTVEETITFGAKLKLKSASAQEIATSVERVIHELALEGCRHVIIGNALKKGVSGGQKKRVAIALELLDDPQLIFLDEPTSGLDSSLAFDIIKILAKMAHSGRTVVATIHQPRSQIYSLFDNLLLLSLGDVMYQGPASDATNYFRDLGYHCPATFNAGDFLLDLLTPKEGKSEVIEIIRASSRVPLEDDQELRQEKGRFFISKAELDSLVPRYWASKYAQQVERDILETKAGSGLTLISPTKLVSARIYEFWWVIYVLIWRHVKDKSRNPSAIVSVNMIIVFIGFTGGLIWFQTEKPRQATDCTQYNNVAGAVINTALQLTFGVLGYSIHFPTERPLFNREVASGMYEPVQWFISKNIGDFPFYIGSAAIHVIIFYWLVGFSKCRLTAFRLCTLCQKSKVLVKTRCDLRF
eukprot:Blabericola_migrator_1__3057@NODE_1891_length_3602_cov_51_942291_g976_i1_p2_GENE_NODE_1891_length_3602_cov_51_942291_g976_i1NODE_1891_length_3602_cov_51_942291_g976_i1_p2_ORF_typecomplete_len523_score42_29ABC_tran/PF00005_27/8_3e28ABC2_membrane/PF01061_24/3_2e19AAA_21/PF13304_6/2_6e08AAA_21/PF13304_6/1_6e03SMC_N/PF02463_19/0_33SMC_N/PF02463_19/0_00046AAA_15/PF13175_6/0_001T2SSE/PF00437_20/0_00017T2SSE/PF00437_20/76AAA_29/PF13555_6/2_6e05MMR_HSR1/PF01926_23/0_00028AAA_33/PF13671_6/0_00063RsgA_GTP